MSNYKEIDGSRYKIADPTIVNDSPDVCFLVEGKYYRLSAGSITYDYTKKRYVLKSSIHVESGFVGIDKDDNPILGSWSWPDDHSMDETIIAHYKGVEFLCISDAIFKDTAWEERLSNGEFYKKSSLPVKEFSAIKSVSRDLKDSYPYNASGSILSDAIELYNLKYKPDASDFDKGVSSYPQVLGKYSYGFEFETTKGFVPPRIYNKLGLIPLRDGSINGIEYATIPLEGKLGLQTIIDISKEMEVRTAYDHDCSLHVHIGGMPRTEEYFISLAKVLCLIQEEMYEMFPFYTRGGFGLKKKDYTAPLPATELLSKIDNNIDLSDKKAIINNFQHVFDFLSMGHDYKDYNYKLKNVISHPSDPSGTSKWYIKSRYRWVNMIPLLFGNKKTIEFRIHTPTYDYNKIIYFTIICASIIDFADRNMVNILTGQNLDYSINNMVYRYLSQFGDKYHQVHDYIVRYMTDRKAYIQKITRKGDFYGKESELKHRFNIYSSSTNSYDVITKSKLNAIFREVDYDGARYRDTPGNLSGSFTYHARTPEPVRFASPPPPQRRSRASATLDRIFRETTER